MSGVADETIQSDADFLGEESEEEIPEEPVEIPEEEEEEEEPPQEEDEPEEEEEEEEKPPAKEDVSLAADLAKAITAKYPNVLKEFPELRTAIFKSAKYEAVFPTLDVAKEAAEKVTHFEALGEKLMQGDSGTLLDSIHDVDPKAVGKIAVNFLPTLYTRSPELFQQAIDPVFRNVLQEMRAQARREKDQALWHTANNVSLFLYGNKNAGPQRQPAPDPEKEELRQKLERVSSVEEERFAQGIFAQIESTLSKEVNAKIDASVQAGLREVIVEKTIAEIKTTMRNNKENLALLNRLAQQAKRNGFDKPTRDAILSAYIRPARALVGKKAAEVTAKITGSTKKVGSESKRIPQTGGNPGGKPEKIDANKVDWSRTSGKDYLAGKIVYKK